MKHVIAVTIAALLALPAPARAQGIAFPADANIKSVRDFGAKGDGVTDDTAAIAAAVKGIGGSHMRSLYFPDGTYLVSDTVLFAEWIFVQGQSTARTRIKLKDSCAGFGDAAKPKPVVCTLAGGGKGSGTMNMNFSTHMLNFTIDTGKGNPGAVGIEFMSHNGGGLEDIVIRSSDGSGPIGLDMRRAGQGPALCRRLVMEGFDVGVWTGPSVYASTFEDMTIRGQKLAGWKNNNHPCTVRKLTSDNKVPMYVQDEGFENGQFVLIDSVLKGGSSDAPAIDNTRKGRYGVTGLFLRNVIVAGYGLAAVDVDRKVTVQEAKGEYHSGTVLEASPSTGKSLGLAVKETPAMPWEAPAGWANVMKYDPVKLDHKTRKPQDKAFGGWIGYDISEALQKAIDSGATTVYLPHGIYLVRKSIHLRGKMRVLQGCGSVIAADKEAMNGQATFVFDGTDVDTVFVDRLSFVGTEAKGEVTAVEHASPRTLVVLHSRWMSYRTGKSASGAIGEMFGDDMCGGPWMIDQPQKLWLRCLNIESSQTKFINKAGTVWVLSFKDEGGGTAFVTGPGAATEVLGGELYGSNGNTSFVCDGGRLSVTIARFWSSPQVLKETRDSKTAEVKTGKGDRLVNLLVSDPKKP